MGMDGSTHVLKPPRIYSNDHGLFGKIQFRLFVRFIWSVDLLQNTPFKFASVNRQTLIGRGNATILLYKFIGAIFSEIGDTRRDLAITYLSDEITIPNSGN